MARFQINAIESITGSRPVVTEGATDVKPQFKTHRLHTTSRQKTVIVFLNEAKRRKGKLN